MATYEPVKIDPKDAEYRRKRILEILASLRPKKAATRPASLKPQKATRQ
jgi:hypothetical protein